MDEKRPLLRLRAAKLISDVVSPPVVSGVLALAIAGDTAPSANDAIAWSVVYIGLVNVVPALFIVYMVATGRITDIHVRVRRQRILPFMVSVVCTLAAWLILRSMNAGVMPELALIGLIEIAVMLLITLFWQISLHAMSITSTVVLGGVVFGLVPALLASPLIPIVSAARVILRRHTVAQVIAGGLLGAVLSAVLFAVLVGARADL